jgi:hypothetical protein
VGSAAQTALALIAAGAVAAGSEQPARADATPPPKPPAPTFVHEPYLTSGLMYFGSDRRVIAGLGGGGGYRLDVGRHVAAFVEARGIVYAGTALTGATGLLFRYRYRGWEPIVGVQVSGYRGEHIEVLSSADPRRAPPNAWAAQARLGLLRFASERFTACALALDWGYGGDAGSLATAINVTLMDVGFRL